MGSNTERLRRLIKSGGGKLVVVGAIAGGGAGLLVGGPLVGLAIGAVTGFAVEAARQKKP
ncbi:MAG: hypothetical protein HKN37_15145 [Rhodothermales bacterium]|nr:hypothetical protein [Rhodothermales bacterium]